MTSLLQTKSPVKNETLVHFYEKWKDDSIVINKWFAAQASAPVGVDVQLIKKLEKTDAFDIQNPNKVRCLYGAFAANLPVFHIAPVVPR